MFSICGRLPEISCVFIVGTLLAINAHAQHNVPLTLAEADLEPTEVFAGRGSPGLCEVARRIAVEAERHLGEARSGRGGLPRAAGPALLPGCLAAGYLKLLARAGHNPFDARLQAPQPGKVWRLLWAALSGRY